MYIIIVYTNIYNREEWTGNAIVLRVAIRVTRRLHSLQSRSYYIFLETEAA
jgi:hypothetical protein